MSRTGKLFVGVLTFLGIQAVFSAWWSELAARDLKLAVALALTLAILIVVSLVAGQPVGRYMEQLGGSLGLVRFIARYDRSYCAWLATRLDSFEASERPTVGPFTPRLEDVFVEPKLAARAPHQISTGVLEGVPPDVTQRRPLNELLNRYDPSVLAVIGAPGSGKTSLLRNVARTIANERGAKMPLLRRIGRLVARRGTGGRRQIPILLELRDHRRAIVADPAVSLAQLQHAAVPELLSARPHGWWEDRLRRGRCVVLLDGLDEVSADHGSQAMVTAWINRQISHYPGNDFVITSRPHAYRSDIIEKAQILQIRPFTDQEVREFVSRWYRSVERHDKGTGPEVDARAQDQANDLLARLAQAPALRDLAINPLLLDMIVKVHCFRKALPASRAELYREICEWTLWRLQAARKLPTIIAGPHKMRLLAELAFTMMGQHLRDMPRAKVLETIRPLLQRLRTGATAAAFLAEVSSSGLLIERYQDVYAFAHMTFQEYLAAAHVRDRHLREMLLEKLDDPWWREVILLYITPADADPIIRSCLDRQTVAALSLAFECADTIAENGAELASDLRDRLDKTITSAFHDDATPEHRRLVAGTLATRRLRQLVSTSSGARICPHPVTTDLYWLFLRDTETVHPDRPCPPDPATPAVATGIWASDAQSFVNWINTIANADKVTYRLPTNRDLQELVDDSGETPVVRTFASSVVSTWTQPNPGQATPGLWTAPEKRATNVLDGADLLNAVAADATQSRLLNQLISIGIHTRAHDLQRAVTTAIGSASEYLNALTIAISRAPAADRSYRQGLARQLANEQQLAAQVTWRQPSYPDTPGGKDTQGPVRPEPRFPAAAARVQELQLLMGRATHDYGPELSRTRQEVAALVDTLHRACGCARNLAATFAPSRDRRIRILAVNGGVHVADYLRDMLGAVNKMAKDMINAGRCVDSLGLRGRSEEVLSCADHAGDASRRVNNLETSLNRALKLCLDRSREHDLNSQVALDHPYSLPTDLERWGDTDAAHTVPTLERELPDVIGDALTDCLRAVLGQRKKGEASPETTFAQALIRSAGMSDAGLSTICLDTLAKDVPTACNALASTRHHTWVATVAHRLATAAAPILTRRQPTHPGTVTIIRLSALTLAAAADNNHQQQLGNAFRDLAAGITLMQHRATSSTPLESLVIAQL